MTYLRSSSTALRTSVDSALTSALMGKFRLTRIFFDLKPGHTNQFNVKQEKQQYMLGLMSYWSVSSLIRIFAFTSSASTCVNRSFVIEVAATSSSNDIVSFLLYCNSTAVWYELVIRMYFWFR